LGFDSGLAEFELKVNTKPNSMLPQFVIFQSKFENQELDKEHLSGWFWPRWIQTQTSNLCA